MFLLDHYFRDAMLMVPPIFRDHSLLDSSPVLMNEPVDIDQRSNTKSSLRKYQSEKYFSAFKSCNLIDVEYFICLECIAADVYFCCLCGIHLPSYSF